MAASCHNPIELRHAEHLNLDFVVLSPVKSTLSHPEADPLGWQKFAALTETSALAIYALGGMALSDLPLALSHGARGVAFQRSVVDTVL